MYNDITYQWYTVEDIYNYCKQNSIPLLSTFSAPFWGQYILDYEKYDRFFANRYKTFTYFNQNPINNTDIASVTDAFINSVYEHLMVNEKNYTELFKIQLLNFGDIQYDFYTEETRKNIRTLLGDYISGTRTDTGTLDRGGSSESVSDTIGSHTISETNTAEHQKMAFDSTSYINDNRDTGDNTQNVSSRKDSSTTTRSGSVDTKTETKGQQNNNTDERESKNGTVTTKGYRENPIENLDRFRKFWNGYSFYGDIFYDISREILII